MRNLLNILSVSVFALGGSSVLAGVTTMQVYHAQVEAFTGDTVVLKSDDGRIFRVSRGKMPQNLHEGQILDFYKLPKHREPAAQANSADDSASQNQ